MQLRRTRHGSSHEFHRCPHKHILQIKFNPGSDILIIYLYVDDQIFIENNSNVIFKFGEVMISHFEMTDLEIILYFLSIEVSQTKEVFITQKKYAVTY